KGRSQRRLALSGHAGDRSNPTFALLSLNSACRSPRRHIAETVMAETQIEWTDATWNPVAGCSIVSAGCTNCYAMAMARRLHAMNINKYRGLTRRSGKRTIWNGVVREDATALNIPL